MEGPAVVAVGMIVVWLGYTVEFYGYTLLKGYDVTIGQLASPMHPYGSGKGQDWPPPLIKSGQVLPSGTGTGTTTTAAKVKLA
jgi:hypothetical protein